MVKQIISSLLKYLRCILEKPNGKIIKCTKILADALECDPNCDVYGELEKFLNKLIAKKL